MKSTTRLLRFSQKTAVKIVERDKCCFFCKMGYHIPQGYPLETQVMDIMHVVPRSHLGLGVEQNGVLGCRYHHTLLDNGNKGLHEEMEGMLHDYMKELYPGWTPETVRYRKWEVLNGKG